MGHLLETMNPAAVERINGEGLPLPGIGAMVIFHPRPGEVRRRKFEVPAIVTAVDHDNRRLELLVIYEADDQTTLQNVPEWVEGERGWSRLPMAAERSPLTPVGEDLAEQVAALRTELATLKTFIYGAYRSPDDQSVLGLIDAMDERLGKLEAAPQSTEVKPRRSLRGR